MLLAPMHYCWAQQPSWPSMLKRRARRAVRLAAAASNYSDNRYWTFYKLPMFGCNDSSQVLKEIANCVKSFPTAYIRLVAFDQVRPHACARPPHGLGALGAAPCSGGCSYTSTALVVAGRDAMSCGGSSCWQWLSTLSLDMHACCRRRYCSVSVSAKEAHHWLGCLPWRACACAAGERLARSRFTDAPLLAALRRSARCSAQASWCTAPTPPTTSAPRRSAPSKRRRLLGTSGPRGAMQPRTRACPAPRLAARGCTPDCMPGFWLAGGAGPWAGCTSQEGSSVRRA